MVSSAGSVIPSTFTITDDVADSGDNDDSADDVAGDFSNNLKDARLDFGVLREKENGFCE